MGFPESSNFTGNGSEHAHAEGKVSSWIYLGSLLAWLGICLCFLLLQEDSGLHAFLCPQKGGCETVLHSPFANIKGVPLPWLGIAFYTGLLGLWLGASATKSPFLRNRMLETVLWVELAGVTFSLGLMYLQFFMLRAFCPLCTASAINVAALFATILQAKRAEAARPGGASPGGALALALFAVLPALLFMGSIFERSHSASGIWLADLSDAHRQGPEEAPVQLIVYSDFECGFCRQLHGVLQRLEGEFPKDLVVVFRHFPLASHPRALRAAIASECAAEQGLFWPYHDKLFTEGGDLSDARLRELAASVGMVTNRFDTCLLSEAPRKAVEANLREAETLRLPGTPFVFLNGRPLTGAPSYENLRRQIREQVRAASSSPGLPR